MDSDAEKKRALSRAYRLLAIRARSSEEMRRALRRAGMMDEVIEETVAHLERQSLIDDRAFAADWARSRMHSRPRGKRLIQQELRAKGIPDEEAASATSGIDDEATALALASRRATLMKGLDRPTFIRRLASYLLTRGFSRETVSRTVSAVISSQDDS
jgi:regulatory protein